MSRSLLTVALLVGCAAPDPGTDTPTTPPTEDTTDTTTPGTTDTSTTTTDTQTTTTEFVVNVTDLQWTLSTYVGSVVTASWTQDVPATIHVEYSFDEGVWQSSPSRLYEPGTNTQVIVGIPYDGTADWRVVVEDNGAQFDGDPITTAAWPAALPHPTVTIDDPGGQLPEGKYLLTSMNQATGGWTGGVYWAMILDRQGRLIWAKRAPNKHWVLFAQLAVTGDHLLWDESTYWSDFDDGAGSVVHRTYLDEEIEVIDTPGLHHEFVQLPDATLAWGSQDHGGGEALVEKAPGQVDETVVWSCTDDSTFGNNCESNGLFYNEATDSYLYSFYTNSTVTEIDRATGDSLWWAGNAFGGFDFDPADSQYSWQHGISYTDAGTLLVSSEYGTPTHTWLLEYEVDQATGVLSLIWSDDSGVYAAYNGQAWRLDNANTLHIVGSAGVAREVTDAGDEVWRMEYSGVHLLGHGQFIDDLYALVKP